MKRALLVLLGGTLGAVVLFAVIKLRAVSHTAPPFSAGGGGVALGVQCVGPEGAGVQLIYLHGIDPPDASPQEQGNRRMLARMADQLHVRIALARSPDTCPKEPLKRCWPNDSQVAVNEALQRLLLSTSVCFDGKPAGMVGFSNGGYFVSKLVQYCLMPEMTGVVAIGSAGSWRASDPQNLSACPRLQVLIGAQDVTRSWAFDYVRHIQSLKGHAAIREYPGGHVVPPMELAQALTDLFSLRNTGGSR